MNESSDWKHLLETASGSIPEKLNHSEKQESILNTTDLICEFVLLDSNYYAQARNLLLFKVLTTEDDDDSESIINSFIAMLYNIHLDEDSFFRMQSSLQRYVLSDYLLLVQFLLIYYIRNEALLYLTNIHNIKSRLINDEASCYGTEIIHIFKKWSSAIETKDDQIELAGWMERMRTSALNEYDSFYDSVLHGLKDISEMQEEALSYWLKNGNLVHHCEKLTKYPNVSLTCECTELDFGKIFVCIKPVLACRLMPAR